MRQKVILVQPKVGFSGVFVKHAPLGLLYASIGLVQHGIDVELLDNRLYPTTWKRQLRKLLDKDVLAVGLSVVSGKPIENAVEVGRFVKAIDPEIKIVWGGPHATFNPETILQHEWSCDYVVSGYASYAFYDLIQCLLNQTDPSHMESLSYRKGNEVICNFRGDKEFEVVDYRKIPYDLIKDYTVYGQLDQQDKIFSMYSVSGCPYMCSFCSSPAQYSTIAGKKWIPLDPREVADHIQHVIEKHDASYIYFIDDDSFPKLDHVEGIIDEITRRRFNVKLGFRGARINEIKRMSDAFLHKLAAAGTDILHIGAESGSNRILKLIRKDCTVDDIIACNRKLARYPQITVAYNFMMGLPTETIEDLRATRDLMLRLVEDHPNCIIFQPNRFRPLPGTELFEMAQREWGYEPPKTLKEWSEIEAEGDYSLPWHTKEIRKFCNLLLIGSYFVDNKVEKVTEGRTLLYKLLHLTNSLYGPIARFRLTHGFYQGLVEFRIYQFITKLATRVQEQRHLSPS